MATHPPQPAAENAAAKLLNRFFHCLDDGRYEEMAELMAPDGVWHRQGKALQGPAAVLAAMRERPAGLVSRHVVSNLVVDAAAEDRAEAAFYATVFAHSGAPGAQPPAPMELPFQLAVFRATALRGGDGWRIGQLSSTPAFKR